MSIEGITLEHFSALPNADINSNTQSRQSHVVFHFLSGDSKQDATTTTAHIKRSIALLKKNIFTASLSTIWENIYGCD